MINDKVATLELQLDISKVSTNLTEVSNIFGGLKRVAENVGTALCKSFDPMCSTIQNIQMDIENLSSLISQLAIPQVGGGIANGIVAGYEDLLQVISKIEKVEINSSKIKGLFEELATAPNIPNLLKSMFPKSTELANTVSQWVKDNVLSTISESLATGKTTISNRVTNMLQTITETFSNSTQKMKDFGSAIGTAFSSFGTTIAQIATSTGAWIANTAAKVANTAAQWAQIAATTAWQGICAAATAVTTAFGAAMTFLTSPIGLVVIGIVALIAIIVLLIANWDTVKAAVLTAWEAVKNALATAAAWVDTNVLQPIVGFFTEAMDWISTKVEEGFALIQGIFAGVNEFLQGIFAKDWTEQFGAFGNVLNAFFANVENIWNAIKNIFSGIVSFVKNVFAGDWGAAWDSIVNVFKGIWDFLVAIVKAPINGIIGLINGLVQGVVDGINLVIGALNGISFDIPDWVPLIGGQTFGFNLALLNAPKIPLLAKGAVLPANRPFLAMVGDQRHGTNIEAPLATIQEAVALVMEDQFAGMMAGFEASVGVQKQILQAVLGIEIGDTTIGQAAARYNTKMAIIRGGM